MPSSVSVRLKLFLAFASVFVLGFGSGYYYLDANRNAPELTVREGSPDCAELFKRNAACPAPAEKADEGAVLGDAAGIGAAAQPEAFAGSKNSTLYHTRTCQYVNRIKAENLVWFGSAAEAEKAGRRPHSCAGN